jgi:hypothetical protein
MIIIDENIPDSQRQLLRSWRISFRQISIDIGRAGMKDDEIIPLLHGLTRPSFFTLDEDFFKPELRHKHYCLVFLDVNQYETAAFIRRTLRHQEFQSTKKRLGRVIRVAHTGLFVWQLNQAEKQLYKWP